MLVLALAMPNGQPLSWVAALVVVLGLIGLGVGTTIRVRRATAAVGYSSEEESKSSTEVSPRV